LSAPDWIVVKRIEEVAIPQEKLQIDLEEWPRIARERINKFVQNKPWFPAEGVNRTNYEREIYEEFAGHGLLRLVAAEDPRVQGWLVEQEGDLFEWRFRKVHTIETKIEVAKYLFGEKNVLMPRELWGRFEIDDKYFKEFKIKNKRSGSIGVKFTCVPKLVNNRSALLRNGWVVALIDDFAMSLKTSFERLLRKRIQEARESVDRIARSSIAEPIKILKEDLSKIIHTMSKVTDRFQLSGYKLFTKQNVFPQCMLDLYSEVERKGHINHEERFQMGLFLKHIGMSVEEQLYFWYDQAVDNIGLTFEQFSSGPAGYQIRYLYGLEGGGTDYSAQKCETIQNNGYCAFLQQSVKTIDDALREEFKNPSEQQEKAIRNLTRKVVDKKPSEACAAMFYLRYNKPAKPIRHPIGYVRYAARVLKILLQEDEKKPEKKK
jgi:DNA primase large subunit